MNWNRSCGVLLHPTSLPGPYGIGDLGPEAIRFLDFLTGSGQNLWQMLPLNPPGAFQSPYQCYSAFAGNPLLIAPDRLVAESLIPKQALSRLPSFSAIKVDFARVYRMKLGLLREAYARARPNSAYAEFCARQANWLDAYALFMALKGKYKGAPWTKWQPGLAKFRTNAIKKAHRELEWEVGFHKFVQFVFFQQHAALKREANERGIRIIGDLPIFVGHNSADVWSHQNLFQLTRAGEPTVVAGVPPDYFSKTGQRWGNPLYRWDAMEKNSYAWWMDRLRMAQTLYDIVRIDHFRGFEAYWEIPARESTAVHGRWVKGPGKKFFQVLRQQLKTLPIIAEDLGAITPEVEALRDRFHLPGMKILQFAFSGPDNEHLPYNYTTPNCVVYTGTHDNNTTRGWWTSATEKERQFVRRLLPGKSSSVSWEMIGLVYGSIAQTAIIPMQDLLGLPSNARMNTPGTSKGNWSWRFRATAVTPQLQRKLGELSTLYGRTATSKTTQ